MVGVLQGKVVSHCHCKPPECFSGWSQGIEPVWGEECPSFQSDLPLSVFLKTCGTRISG